MSQGIKKADDSRNTADNTQLKAQRPQKKKAASAKTGANTAKNSNAQDNIRPLAHWTLIGASVQGSMHIKNEIPNQDAIQSWQQEKGGLPIILALADGHGSANCFRSGEGARIAVKLAVEVLREMIPVFEQQYSAAKENAMFIMPRTFLQRWRQAVMIDTVNTPYTFQELSGKNLADLERNAYLPYGTTLLIAMVLRERILFWQLGDGNILAITDDGELFEPVERDELLIANETTSLCLPTALNDFRCAIIPYSRPFKLIMLSTDGYANSFRDNAGFFKAANDYLELLETTGPDNVRKLLPGWLDETSGIGSGDDITLGLIWPGNTLDKAVRMAPL